MRMCSECEGMHHFVLIHGTCRLHIFRRFPSNVAICAEKEHTGCFRLGDIRIMKNHSGFIRMSILA